MNQLWELCVKAQEEYERLYAASEKKEQQGINTRQWVLKMWLEKNQVKGHFFSIEEIVESVTYCGEHLYELNTNPKIHDKCLLLSQDVNAINDSVVNGYKIIIKDSKGGIKLCESKDEFDRWYYAVTHPLFKILKRMNLLKWKTEWQDTMPIVNKAGNAVKEKDLSFIDVFCNFDDDSI